MVICPDCKGQIPYQSAPLMLRITLNYGQITPDSGTHPCRIFAMVLTAEAV